VSSTNFQRLSGIWVVIAAYNERAMIAEVVRPLIASGYSVIVVDDGSRDDTAACARAAGADVLRHVLNRGQGQPRVVATKRVGCHWSELRIQRW
jgi:glycosyltransferase involved in cell wall biosynthesis